MYERFYGLQERPFDLTPNPRYLLLTGKHREALSTLQYGISARKGITLLTGEAGTGKTTLVRAALDGRGIPNARCACLSNPALTRAEFYEFLAAGFQLSEAAAASKTRFLMELTRAVTERRAAGGITALILDEAQSLSDELLEEIRLLANIETATEKLLPVVLVGQPEIRDRLNLASLRQLKQRVALSCVLPALSGGETAAYIATRIRIAGGHVGQLFTSQAIATIHEKSEGIPRTISVICDNALISGFAADQRPVGRDLVLEVCQELDLSPRVEVRQGKRAPAAPVEAPPKAVFVPVAPNTHQSRERTAGTPPAPANVANEVGSVKQFARRLAMSLFS